MRSNRDPRSKEDLLDRLMMADFDGDVRALGRERAKIERVDPYTVRLTFPFSGAVFDLEVHRPREANQAARKESRSFDPASNELNSLWGDLDAPLDRDAATDAAIQRMEKAAKAERDSREA